MFSLKNNIYQWDYIINVQYPHMGGIYCNSTEWLFHKLIFSFKKCQLSPSTITVHNFKIYGMKRSFYVFDRLFTFKHFYVEYVFENHQSNLTKQFDIKLGRMCLLADWHIISLRSDDVSFPAHARLIPEVSTVSKNTVDCKPYRME